jgi:hypothetical protein
MENDSPKEINPQEVLDEAGAIRAQRGSVYGHPYVNHRRIANFWSTYLDYPITPDQVAVCMALVKISRIAETPGHRGRDGYVDGVAYLSLAAMLSTIDPYEFDDAY